MSNNSSSSSSSGGIGFTGLLAIAFIVLKLCHVIDWSWWWVLSPIWIGFAIVAAVLLVIGVGALVALVVKTIADRRRRRNFKARNRAA